MLRLLVGFLCLVGMSCSPVYAVPQKEKKKAQATVLKIEVQNLSDVYRYPAQVDSKINANILAENDGAVDKIKVNVGSIVKKGDLLLVLRNVDPAYQFAPVKIYAPVAGVVSEMPVTLGTRVARGTKVAAIIDPKQLRITAEIPASDVGLFIDAGKGEFTTSFQDEPVAVKVRGVSPFVDPKSGTAPAEFEITEAKATSLRPGIMGQVRFELSKRQAFTLPTHAIVYRDGKTFARIVENGKLKNIAIELGKRQGDTFEIKSGMKSGLTVVERLSRIVGDGEEVQINSSKN